MVNNQQPKSLWPVQVIERRLYISVDTVVSRMYDPKSRLLKWYKDYNLTPLSDGRYSFEIRVQKSSVIAFGRITTIDMDNCNISVKIGMDWKPLIIQIAVASILSFFILLFILSFDLGAAFAGSASLVILSYSFEFLNDWGIMHGLTQKIDSLG